MSDSMEGTDNLSLQFEPTGHLRYIDYDDGDSWTSWVEVFECQVCRALTTYDGRIPHFEYHGLE